MCVTTLLQRLVFLRYRQNQGNCLTSRLTCTIFVLHPGAYTVGDYVVIGRLKHAIPRTIGQGVNIGAATRFGPTYTYRQAVLRTRAVGLSSHRRCSDLSACSVRDKYFPPCCDPPCIYLLRTGSWYTLFPIPQKVSCVNNIKAYEETRGLLRIRP
jgi:hypothetical protein